VGDERSVTRRKVLEPPLAELAGKGSATMTSTPAPKLWM